MDGVSLTIRPGELISLLGPSGSGKTTVLRLVAGFEQPTAGEIYIGDRPARGIPPHRRNLGMVAQDFALFPHMTVAQNVAFGLKMRHTASTEIPHRIEEALSLVDLKGYGARMPNQLSGGQQQRVALARALVTRPQVLLLDEPFGALDRKLRDQLQIEVRHLQQQVGITAIFVTHDQSEALSMADRIALMQKGRLEQVGSPLEIYEKPATRFAADFIGLTNFINATIAQVGTDRVVLKGPRDCALLAPPVEWAKPDLRVEVAVRPEKLSVVPIEGGNHLRGRIAEVVYLGDRTKIAVKLADDSSCLVISQNMAPGRQVSLAVGNAIDLFWQVDAGIVLRSDRA